MVLFGRGQVITFLISLGGVRTKTVDVIDPPRELELLPAVVVLVSAVSSSLLLSMSTHLPYSLLVRDYILPSDRPTLRLLDSTAVVCCYQIRSCVFFSHLQEGPAAMLYNTLSKLVGWLVAFGRRPPTNRVVLACGGQWRRRRGVVVVGHTVSLLDKQSSRPPSQNISEAIFMQDS